MSDNIDISREAVAWARMTLDADFIEMGETTTYNSDTITEVIRKLNIALSRMSALRAALDAAEAEKARAVEAERERCAAFVQNMPRVEHIDWTGKIVRRAATREQIAAAIRTGAKP